MKEEEIVKGEDVMGKDEGEGSKSEDGINNEGIRKR